MRKETERQKLERELKELNEQFKAAKPGRQFSLAIAIRNKKEALNRLPKEVVKA